LAAASLLILREGLAQTHTDFKLKNFPPEKKGEFSKASAAFKEGEKQYKLFKEGKIVDPGTAISLLKTAFDFNPNHIALNRYLTDLLLLKPKNPEALPHLEKLYDMKADLSPMELFLLGSLLQMNGQFFRAEYVFKEFLNESGDDIFWTEGRIQKATKRIEECVTGQSLSDKKKLFSTGKGFLDKPIPYDAEHLFYNHFTGWYYFSEGKPNSLSGKAKKSLQIPVEHSTKRVYSDINCRTFIYSDDSAFYEKTGAAHFELTEINESGINKDPFITNDLSKIYFSSNRPGGYGGFDIWIAYFSAKGELTEIKNAGKAVNDEYDQMAPFLSSDEKYFFVSSNGKGTVGGFDIFYGELNDSITKLKNIGFPLNSGHDETGIIFDITGTKGFVRRLISDSVAYIPFKETAGIKNLMLIGGGFKTFSGGEIKHKDYSLKPDHTFASEICKLRVWLPRHEFGETTVEIYDLNTGKTYFWNHYHDSTTIWILIPANRNFGIFSTTQNGTFSSQSIRFSPGENFTEKTCTIKFKPLKKGSEIVLENILFSRDYLEMQPESKFEINRIARWLKEHPKVKVEIAVHTDPLSMHGVAIAAGESAAFQVTEILKSEGIEKKRLDWMFYGSEKPLKNDQSSKRIELIITDK
jgi:outer membrane protein OmpA-like peptidoglycan-associated protein/tetratricopeptide (TPR) repeat protein